jgi:hypothetical protein
MVEPVQLSNWTFVVVAVDNKLIDRYFDALKRAQSTQEVC